MIHGLPYNISLLFIITTALTAGFLVLAFPRSIWISFLILSWLVVQSILAMNGFYFKTSSVPPRFLLAILPPAIVIICIFLLPSGKKILDKSSLSTLTIIHITRIMVETCLLFLFIHKTIPRLMTFEGRNFDILSGLSAPFVWYYAFIKRSMSRKLLIAWNIICLVLVLNVVIHGILAAPSVIQKLAFEQPNMAVLYFPFIWLPAFVVPVIIFSHLACLRHLFLKKDFFTA